MWPIEDADLSSLFSIINIFSAEHQPKLQDHGDRPVCCMVCLFTPFPSLCWSVWCWWQRQCVWSTCSKSHLLQRLGLNPQFPVASLTIDDAWHHCTIVVYYGLTEHKLYKKQIMSDTIQTQDVIRRWIRGEAISNMCLCTAHVYK